MTDTSKRYHSDGTNCDLTGCTLVHFKDGLLVLDNPDNLTDTELPYDCPYRETDGAWCGYPVGKAGVCRQGHHSSSDETFGG